MSPTHHCHRFYETAHLCSADYDYLAIVEGYTQPKENNVAQFEDIDVALYERASFQGNDNTPRVTFHINKTHHHSALLDQHVPWAVQFLYFPPSAIVFEKEPLSLLLTNSNPSNIRFSFDLQYTLLNRATSLNTTVNERQARGMWREGDVRRSKKKIFYIIQITQLMTQIAQHGRIIN